MVGVIGAGPVPSSVPDKSAERSHESSLTESSTSERSLLSSGLDDVDSNTLSFAASSPELCDCVDLR